MLLSLSDVVIEKEKGLNFLRAGVGFDSWRGEAYYNDKMDPILKELGDKKLLSESEGTHLPRLLFHCVCSTNTVFEGALVVDLSSLGMKKPCLIRRKDGGSLYATRDLAAAEDRWAQYHPYRSLYVVDAGQSLHFQVRWGSGVPFLCHLSCSLLLQEWFSVAKLLNREYADRLRHVKFGVMLMWSEEEGGWARCVLGSCCFLLPPRCFFFAVLLAFIFT